MAEHVAYCQIAVSERHQAVCLYVPFYDFSDKVRPPENLKKYVFSDDGEKNKVRLSINALTIVTTDYRQFRDFAEQVEYVVKSFYNSFGVENCLRMGLRYINIYTLHEELDKSISEDKELFISFLNTELISTDQMFSNNIEVRKNLPENNKITLRSKLLYNKGKNKFQHIIDFDVYTHNKIPLQNYQSAFSDLRTYEKTEFLKYVTEKFMSKMKFLD